MDFRDFPSVFSAVRIAQSWYLADIVSEKSPSFRPALQTYVATTDTVFTSGYDTEWLTHSAVQLVGNE